MESNKGPNLVGVIHFGLEEALDTIRTLERAGLKDGDTVTVENTQLDNDSVLENLKNGKARDLLELENLELKKLEHQIRKTKDRQTFEKLFKEIELQKSVIGNLEFNFQLYSYFSIKHIRVLGLESPKIRRLLEKKGQESSKDPKLEYKTEIIRMAAREADWIKKLSGIRTDFVLVGCGHVKGLKNKFKWNSVTFSSPNSEALSKRIWKEYKWTDLRYKIYKGWKKTKRIMGKNINFRKKAAAR